MKKIEVQIHELDGKTSGKIDLPRVFSTPVREDIIIRAFLSTMSKHRQDYGTDPDAGKKSSAHYHGRRRRERWTMMNREMSRMPRLHGKIPGYLMYRARIAPHTVKGREAHPPKVEKVWSQKINKKERKFAVRSAIAATADSEIVKKRGHRIGELKELPIVIVNDIENIKKTKDLRKILESMGLKDELERIEQKSLKAGHGKMRYRKFRKKTGPLIVVEKDSGITKAVKNIPGVHVTVVDNLSVEQLAPGATPGRLTIFTKGAIGKLGAEKTAGEKPSAE